MKISVGVSNRHVHLKRETIEQLFGKNYEFNNERDLNQPGQFVSNLKVTLKTKKDEISNVRVLGPIREYNQVEISRTDSYKLGLNPPIRDSGDISASSPITIVGPKGEVDLEEGCIIATRHIHISTRQMEYYGFSNNKVSVLVDGEKGAIINNVSLKITDPAFLEIHLDTDDANALNLKNGDIVTVIGIDNENKNM